MKRPHRGPKKPTTNGPKPPFYKRSRYWKIAGIGTAAVLGFVVVSAIVFAKDIPGPKGIQKNLGTANTILFDRTGKEIVELHGDENRKPIDFSQIPNNVKNATIAVEDKNFYKEGGFDLVATGRALYYDLRYGSLAQGGSTITQQFVKNAVLSDNKSIWRKYKEIILSIEMNFLYSKQQILQMYLNEIPYGSQAYGIEAASETYFNTPAKNLDTGPTGLSEAAYLAALPQAPTYYTTNPDDAITRRNKILDLMTKQRYITADQATAAKQVDVISIATANEGQSIGGNPAPHFTQYVREQLVGIFGEKKVDQGGLKVTTTLDLGKQALAEQAIHDNLGKVKLYGGDNAALVSEDPKTGEILAMVGSANYADASIQGQVNVATANRQPGSSFKPYVYATAFKKNYFPGSTLFDLKTDFGGGYSPNNYNLHEYGPVSMRQALDNSLNISAVKTLYLAGITDSIQTAHDMGITTLKAGAANYGLSLVLGGGEVKLIDHVAGFSTFAAGGVRHPQIVVKKVTDMNGKTVYEGKTHPVDAIDPQVAYMISNVISDNPSRALVFGTNNFLNLGSRPVAAKTGTTENFRDAWTMGYTPSLAAGVWTGNTDGTFMNRSADGSIVAAPIWHEYMQKALANTPVEQFDKPAGIKAVTVDTLTGKKPGPGTKQTRTDIAASWTQVPNAPTDSGQTYTIDKVSGKLATDLTPEADKQVVTTSNVHCELPPADPSYARWEAPVAAWAKAHGFGSGSIPTDSDNIHTTANRPTISIVGPATAPHSNSIPITVTMTVNAPLSVDHVEIDLDGTDNAAADATVTGNGTTYTAQVVITGSPASIHHVQAQVFDKGQWDPAASNTLNIIKL